MKKVKLIFAVIAMLFPAVTFAQNVQVTGTVKDANGEVVSGAAVQLKGSTTTYSMTDATGGYAISVPSNGTLVVSCLGYKTAEIAVDGRKVVNVVLELDTDSLDDVIVVAYGTVRKEAATGAVSTMGNDGLAESPALSVDKMLAGKVAGVTITSETGQPGASSQIRIRGTSSINAGNEPLWVVDGIPVMTGDQSYFTNTNNAIGTINPNDIESITILKDAAAASIYGSRAANGVILVTTKSGKAGKATFTARAKMGVSSLANDNNFRPMTGAELLDFYRVAAVNAGTNPDDPSSPYYNPKSILTGTLNNWLEACTKLGFNQEYEINASAGNEKGKFYTSFAYQDTDGVVDAVNYTRLTGRVNTDYKLTNTLEIGTRINLSYTENHDTEMQSLYYSNPFFAGLTIRPWTPIFDPETGEYNLNIPENSNTSPLYNALCHGEDQWEKQYRTQASMYLQWEPVKNLIFKTNNMFEGMNGQGRRYWGPDPGDVSGTLQTSNNQHIRLTTSNTASYTFDLGLNNFSFLVGQEAMKHSYQYVYAYAPTVDANIPYLSTAIASEDSTSQYMSFDSLLSFFGNANWNYDQRYFLQASIREDGSSLFGAQNKWGLFWSASGSWNLTNEKWLKSTSNWLSLLKLRLSYGVNGNNNISAYKAYGVYASAAYNGGTGMLPSSPANDVLSWEKNKTWNLGLDFGFLYGRVNGQIDLYTRDTEDMLLSKRVPSTSGFSSNFMNIGTLNNKGIEFMLEGDIVRNADFVWSAGFNIALNRSKILDLGDDTWMSASYDSRLQHVVGHNFYTFYLKDYAGVNPSNGSAIWWHHEYAKNEDGSDNLDKIISSTLTNDYAKSSYVYAGSPEAKATGGFNTAVAWKGLELGAFFEYKLGNMIFLAENRYLQADGNQMTMNQSNTALNYWKKPGDTACNPIPVAGNSTNSYNIGSTRYLQKGDYLRIKDVTLSYTLPEKALKPVYMKNVKAGEFEKFVEFC
ncbi:MAG: TonB-dependent receptor, partial [Bacteroidales bacterium]|nr:TonB-dependent receptor [Bacteroidales bacterium]